MVYNNVADHVCDWYNPSSGVVGDTQCKKACDNDSNCDAYQVASDTGNCDLIKNIESCDLKKLKDSTGGWSFIQKCGKSSKPVKSGKSIYNYIYIWSMTNDK